MLRAYLLLWVALLLVFGSAGLPARESEDNAAAAEKLPESVRLRLLQDAPAVPEAVQTEILEWVRKFQNAVNRLRIWEFVEMTDMEALAASLKNPDKRVSAEERAEMGRFMAGTFEKNFPAVKEFFSFESADVRRIDLTGAEAIVLARIKEPTGGGELKVRWWLRQENGRWRMTDYEVLTINMRLSVLLGLGGQAGSPWRAFGKMFAAQESGEFELLLETAESVEKEEMPPTLREILIVGKIRALAELGESEKIKTEIDKLEAVAPQQPMLAYLRAATANDEGDYANVVKWAEKFGAASGHDGETWQMLTEALLELKRPGKARLEAEKWMAEYPESVDAVWAYCRSLKGDPQRSERLKPHLERLAKGGELETFADYADDTSDSEVLALTVAFMKARGHNAESISDYEESLEYLRERAETEKKEKPEAAKARGAGDKEEFKLPPPPGANDE